MNNLKLTTKAIENLQAAGFDVDITQSLLDEGNFGELYDYESNEYVRPATAAEAMASFEAGIEGVITIEGDRRVFVQY